MEFKSGLLRVLLFLMILGFSYIHSLGAAPLSRSLKLAGDHEGPLIQSFENQVQLQVQSLMEGRDSNYYYYYHAGSRELMAVEVDTSDDYHTGANNHHDPKPP